MLQLVIQLTKRSDISYRKLLEEVDKDPEAMLVRQAILEDKPELLPPWFKRFSADLTVKIGLVCQGDKLLIPKSLHDWILQIAHGDHAGQIKMKETVDMVFWPNQSKDIEEKAASCITCFESDKNLKSILPVSEINREKNQITQPGKTIQLDFVGPVVTNPGRKMFVLMANDWASIWPKAIISKNRYYQLV